MTVLIRENVEKTPTYQPLRLRARVTDMPVELALPVLALYPDGLIRGVKVNDFSPLPPYSHFRKAVLFGAKMWIRDMLRQDEHFELLDHEGDILVYGPYQPKGAMWSRTGEWAEAWKEGDWVRPGLLDFQLSARFTAKYGRVIEMPKKEQDRA